MKFAQPYLLNLLWMLIPVFGIMVYGILNREKILSKFANATMFPLIAPGVDPKRRWIKAGLITMASGFAILALAGPQLGYRWEKTIEKGVDIMIALDCSKSMLAQDIKPSRLERAKREIIDLLHMMKSDRAGLVAFSGRAILQCPLTLDHEAFNIFLKVLEPGFLPMGGTNLGEAIRTSYNGFEKESDTDKAIIIITDGENTAGDVEETAKEMAKQGIKIFCIGVGDLAGAPIPDENGGFKKDAKGNIILSKVDEQGLEKLAAMTGGTYVRSVAGDMDLDLIYKDKIYGTMERKTLTSGKKKVWENRYQWFLFPGLLLLLAEFMLSSKKKVNKISIFVFAVSLSLFAFQNDPVYAKTISSSVKQGIKAYEAQNFEQAKKHFIDAQLESPENEKLYYDIGTAAYMNNEFDQAKKNFTQAAKAKDIQLRHDARYNLANTDYRLGNLDEAEKGYENILKEFPEDREAKENLEFVRQKKQELQQKKESDQDKDKKDKDNKDKDKKKGQDQDKNQDNKKQQDKDSGQDKHQEKNGQNKSSEKNTDKPEDNSQQQKQENAKENQQAEQPAQPGEDKQQQAKGNETSPPEDKQQQQANANLQKMLNRLEDKPGRAMMPMLQEQHVEKDW